MNEPIADKIKEFLPTIGISKNKSTVAVHHNKDIVKIIIEGPIDDGSLDNKDERE